MTTTKERRTEVLTKFQAHPSDTGSTSVQVAFLTERIAYISAHLKNNPKDFAGERGLLKLVGQRRRLLRYLKETNLNAYHSLIKQLDMRK
ncbi:MAG: 30S ribosomal protein S15 [Elusimicrobiaceae bacterium]|nr:30S ribosomal protein S15 [Elusimicrobiaceae bacterium]